MIDRKPGSQAPPAILATSPDGTVVVDIQVLPDELDDSARRSFVRSSLDGGVTWSPLTRLPRSLAGDSHRATYLDDGRLAVAFWDRGVGSPTRGDLVLWVGTFAQLVAANEGLFTCRLTSGWQRPRAGSSAEPFVRIDDAVPGEPSVMAAALEPGSTDQFVVAVRVPIAELDALTPSLEARTPTARDRSPTRATIDAGVLLSPGPVSTVALDGGAALLAATTHPDVGDEIVLRKSLDGGATWSGPIGSLVATAPEGRASLHVVPKPGGAGRRVLLVTGGYPVRVTMSDDDGATWSLLQPVGAWGASGSFGSVVDGQNGDLIAAFHDDGTTFSPVPSESTPARSSIYVTRSADAGV